MHTFIQQAWIIVRCIKPPSRYTFFCLGIVCGKKLCKEDVHILKRGSDYLLVNTCSRERGTTCDWAEVQRTQPLSSSPQDPWQVPGGPSGREAEACVAVKDAAPQCCCIADFPLFAFCLKVFYLSMTVFFFLESLGCYYHLKSLNSFWVFTFLIFYGFSSWLFSHFKQQFSQ